jgi:late competence protein required for DNA uptake (superfamily II DNA/RNA helicase)
MYNWQAGMKLIEKLAALANSGENFEVLRTRGMQYCRECMELGTVGAVEQLYEQLRVERNMKYRYLIINFLKNIENERISVEKEGAVESAD